MAAKSKRQEDAESIVGEVLADELEEKTQEIVGRSGPSVDPGAIVLKDSDGFPPGEGEEEEEDEGRATGTADEDAPPEEESDNPFAGRSYGGAKTLTEAETFLIREGGGELLLGDWNILKGVLTNIAGDEHESAISQELSEFQTTLGNMNIRALERIAGMGGNMKDEVLVEESAPEESAEVAEAEAPAEEAASDEGIGHALEGPIGALVEAFDEAKATPVDAEAQLKMIQPAIQDLGKAIVGSVSNPEGSDAAPAGTDIAATVQAAVQAAVAPLAADLADLKQRSADPAKVEIPRPRAYRHLFEAKSSYEGPVNGATARVAEEVAAAGAGVGVGSGFQQPGVINTMNDASPGTATPKLSQLIRQSVGIRE